MVPYLISPSRQAKELKGFLLMTDDALITTPSILKESLFISCGCDDARRGATGHHGQCERGLGEDDLGSLK